MKRNTTIWILVSILAGLVLPSTYADENDVLRRIDRKLMPEGYESYRQLIDEYPDGKKKDFTVYSIKKGTDKTATLFLAPTSEKGRTTLRLGGNMWLLIPNVGKPVRITSLQSVTGGVFNNADIMQLEYASEYNVVQSAKEGDGVVWSYARKTKRSRTIALKCGRQRTISSRRSNAIHRAGCLLKPWNSRT